jgi:hypothetical protein
MGLRLHFNQKTWETFAKHLRLYSWGVGGLFTSAGYELSDGLVLFSSILLWFAFQLGALVLESVTHDGKEERSKP